MSDVLRIIGGGLLALIVCYIGVLIKRRYSLRYAFFKSANEFAKQLNSELSTLKTPVPDVAKSFLKTRKGEFESCLGKWLEASLSYDKQREQIFDISLLKEDEKRQMQAFFSPLGKSVLSEQISHISNFQKRFEEKASECEKESKRLGNMYFKLCVLIGLALLLIFA